MFSCSNPMQNQLLNDTCIFIEDGPPSAWWMSPDIILNDTLVQPPGSIPLGALKDTAIQGANNQVTVRAHKSCTPAGSDFVVVELYVANPSLNITPTINSALIFQEVIPVRDFSPFALVTKTWLADRPIPPSSTQPDPDSNRLHRCLIARCYPDTLSAPGEKFCVLEDQHVAQRNIAIVAAKGRKISFFIQTGGQNPEIFESATIRTIADRAPSRAVLDAILPSLKQFEGFRQIAQIAPKQFALQVPEQFSPIIRDNSRLLENVPINPGNIPFRDKWRFVFRDGANFGRFRDAMFNPAIVLQQAVAARKFNAPLNVRSLQVAPNLRVAPNLVITKGMEKLVEQAAPTFEADIKLPPQEIANFTFTADLPENSQPGDAHIFHVMHINDEKQVIGGLTIVAVVA